MVLQGDFEGHLYGLLRTPLSPSLWPLELHLYGPPGTLWGPSLWSLGPSLWSSGDPFGAISMAFRATPMVLQEHFWGPSLWSSGPTPAVLHGHFWGRSFVLWGHSWVRFGPPFPTPQPHISPVRGRGRPTEWRQRTKSSSRRCSTAGPTRVIMRMESTT